MKQQCSNCKYSVKIDDEHYICRFNPPEYLKDADRFVYPVMHPEDSCGQFKERTTSEEPKIKFSRKPIAQNLFKPKLKSLPQYNDQFKTTVYYTSEQKNSNILKHTIRFSVYSKTINKRYLNSLLFEMDNSDSIDEFINIIGIRIIALGLLLDRMFDATQITVDENTKNQINQIIYTLNIDEYIDSDFDNTENTIESFSLEELQKFIYIVFNLDPNAVQISGTFKLAFDNN